MLELARVIAGRSTCRRRAVGAVAVDSYGRVLSMGHNGVPRGQAHCADFPCSGFKSPSGVDLGACQAVHAEMNALLFCPDVMKIDTLYVTTSPCLLCTRMILNTSCRRIIYDEVYDQEAIEWLTSQGATVEKLP